MPYFFIECNKNASFYHENLNTKTTHLVYESIFEDNLFRQCSVLKRMRENLTKGNIIPENF